MCTGPFRPRMSRLVETAPVAGWAGTMRAELLLAMTKVSSVELTIELWERQTVLTPRSGGHARAFPLERFLHFVFIGPEILQLLQSQVLQDLWRGSLKVRRKVLGGFMGKKVRGRNK